jgi:hypothetical protein
MEAQWHSHGSMRQREIQPGTKREPELSSFDGDSGTGLTLATHNRRLRFGKTDRSASCPAIPQVNAFGLPGAVRKQYRDSHRRTAEFNRLAQNKPQPFAEKG